MRKSIKYLAGVLLGVIVMGLPVSAAEHKVTDVSGVLYTNNATAVYTDADGQTLLLPKVDPGLPILVTGVTDNGYFRIDLAGQVLYIPGIGLSQPSSAAQSAPSPAPAPTVPAVPEAAPAADVNPNIYNALIAQKDVFPEGMSWTNENFVPWNGGIYSGGYGCAGFAFALSDAAFGNASAKMHSDFNNIRVGDIVRMDNDTHSVIVLEVNADTITVAEGNYNSSVHWGRTISRARLLESVNNIITRY